MKLSAPKKFTFCLAVILLIVGIVGYCVAGLPTIISGNAFWFEAAAAIILALGCYLKGF